MAQNFDLLVRGAILINHDGIGPRDIGVKGGRIAALGDLSGADAGEVIDATGLHILPGVIDTQVHFREPGAEHKEDLETGSRAAVLGGVTAVFEMPNTKPLTTSAEMLADKLARAHGRMHCDHAFWVGGTHANARDVAELERLPGAAGIKVFMGSSTGDLLVADDEGVEAILRNTRRRAAFHSEDEMRLKARLDERRENDPSSHPVWRDVEAALSSTRRLVAIARRTGAAIHILHVSTAEEMTFLAAHKDVASIEVTPHHLTLSVEEYSRLGTLLQMNPPVRGAEHRTALWTGVENGTADILGSDHAPHTLEEKAAVYPASPSGMPGVQTLLPVMLDHAAKGRLSLLRLMDMTSAGPARLFGIRGKGRVAVGYDADLTLVDLKRETTITNASMGSRSKWTPYDGKPITGAAIGTIIRGRRVMWEGEITTASIGEPVRFWASA
ncbi:dihydroorotase [Afifella marina]|uniref:Dihydroorotase n=1 Tax=Afifella marina DSM 2698 TaxID=1120955 RepID=A0A1G5MB69_AFIMA|nr:dihydroorotase [Afifella marina]MBK1622730.1 dihydroorotase [Afifella marina DSM 2698]MBK1625725.1 dihydroorotase [Afifella marina]MBK5917548.1 dihydroorotase [Afifella marina]RAI23480.1 dihydroorotase [Afifella marina DSM 2698]SCZ22034.1 dihydroorotase [Afifella marina DSM 2698]